ncbi:MAG: TetR/AcrR family transcriptional regulator [Spirochaetes bacterium]|nr:TetR/AcrR family transcriptional regulator [Spirochaetota bacterium]
MPRAFTEAERARIRERLIAAGKVAINRSGLRFLVVDDVSREAGISKGSFYSFFPSREDFILSVFEAWELEYRGALLKEITEGTGSPQEKLERFFLEAFGMLNREPGLARISPREIERLIEGLPPERIAAHQSNDLEVLSRAFADWAEGNMIDRQDLEALPGVVSALFSIALHKDDFRQGSYEAAVRLILESLAMRLAAGPKGRAS